LGEAGLLLRASPGKPFFARDVTFGVRSPFLETARTSAAGASVQEHFLRLGTVNFW
jgi:hypothetical protein